MLGRITSAIPTGSEGRAKNGNWRAAGTNRKPELKEKNAQKEVAPLPPELWRQILNLLRTSEKLLVQLRRVSWQWRALIDEILRETSAPYLSHWIGCQQTGSELWIQARNFTSSRFRTLEQLQKVLNFPPEADSAGSPFPTGVVILCPYYGILISSIFERDRIRKYNQCVPKFLARFGKWISTLVYFFHPEDPDFRPVPLLHGSILKMPHLRNLCLYKDNWDFFWENLFQHRESKTGRPEPYPELSLPSSPTSLKQLQLGTATKQFCVEFLTPILLFTRFPSVLESVTSLEFDWPWDPPQQLNRMLEPKPNTNSRFLHCPQLQRLKIRNPNLELLRHFCEPEAEASKPKLQALSLIISGQKQWESWRLLRGLVPLLDKHYDSLQSFTLEVRDELAHRELIREFETGAEDDANLFQDTGVSFPVLKEQSLHLNMMMEPDWWPDVQLLFWKFPNLKKLSLPGQHDGSDLVNFYLKKWLKELVPPGVAGIRLPDYENRFVVREEVKDENEGEDGDGDDEGE